MRPISTKDLPQFINVWTGKNRPTRDYVFSSASDMCFYLSFLPCGFYVNTGRYGGSYCVIKFDKAVFNKEKDMIVFTNSTVRTWTHRHAIGQELTIPQANIKKMFIAEEGICVIQTKDGSIFRITSLVPKCAHVFEEVIDMKTHIREYLKSF